VETGVLLQTLEGQDRISHEREAEVSHDGRLLACGDYLGKMQIYKTESDALPLKLEGNPDRITSMTFSHDGKRLASAGEDWTVRIWDAEAGTLLQTTAYPPRTINSMAYSYDDQRLACGSVRSKWPFRQIDHFGGSLPTNWPVLPD
jgi:WD40 repeat protein